LEKPNGEEELSNAEPSGYISDLTNEESMPFGMIVTHFSKVVTFDY
jgi:hypothetical protein